MTKTKTEPSEQEHADVLRAALPFLKTLLNLHVGGHAPCMTGENRDELAEIILYIERLR